MNAEKEIDTRGLNCPLPILKAKKALADMSTGQGFFGFQYRQRAVQAACVDLFFCIHFGS